MVWKDLLIETRFEAHREKVRLAVEKKERGVLFTPDSSMTLVMELFCSRMTEILLYNRIRE